VVRTSPESPGPSSHEADSVIVLGAQPDGASRSAARERVRSLIRDRSKRVVICDVGQISGPAIDVLDTLAYLQLTARRCGGQIRLRHAHWWLVQLLELTGLAVALPIVDDERATAPGRDLDRNPELPPPRGAGRHDQPEQ
jgi:hypothetical protein